MRKKIALFLCMILLILSCMPALGEESAPEALQPTPLYAAVSNVKFHIRKTPEDGSRKTKTVASHDRVSVYRYGDEWCFISFEGVTGYCKTRWLYRFRSLQPFNAPVPGAARQMGIARVTAPVQVSVKGYEGNLLATGDILSVSQWSETAAVAHMMRQTTQIPAANLSFTPFVTWKDAMPGDLIGGFTTYYNEKTGGRLSKNRQHNIELACQRMNGAVVKQGEVFSFNALCSPYVEHNGYKLAPNISKEGQGYGGGVCQVSTTLYNTVLGLPLQVEEWSIHRDAGVAYAPRFFDAAVGLYSDFAFTNTLPYGIRLEALPQHGVLTVLISRE